MMDARPRSCTTPRFHEATERADDLKNESLEPCTPGRVSPPRRRFSPRSTRRPTRRGRVCANTDARPTRPPEDSRKRVAPASGCLRNPDPPGPSGRVGGGEGPTAVGVESRGSAQVRDILCSMEHFDTACNGSDFALRRKALQYVRIEALALAVRASHHTTRESATQVAERRRSAAWYVQLSGLPSPSPYSPSRTPRGKGELHRDSEVTLIDGPGWHCRGKKVTLFHWSTTTVVVVAHFV